MAARRRGVCSPANYRARASSRFLSPATPAGNPLVPLTLAPSSCIPSSLAPLKLASSSIALRRSAPVRLAPEKSAPMRLVPPRKSAPVRLARANLARSKFDAKLRRPSPTARRPPSRAYDKSASLTLARRTLEPRRSALTRTAPLKSASSRLLIARPVPVRLAPLNLAALRPAIASLTPCSSRPVRSSRLSDTRAPRAPSVSIHRTCRSSASPSTASEMAACSLRLAARSSLELSMPGSNTASVISAPLKSAPFRLAPAHTPACSLAHLYFTPPHTPHSTLPPPTYHILH